MQRPIVGILGGMGPAATADLYQKIIAATPASRDQDHLHVVVWADPSVPDRTTALLHGGEDPTPWLRRGARMLVQIGATFIAVPCNTAHAFLPRIAADVSIPFMHMMDEAASAVAVTYPSVERIGLLATSGTIAAGLYQEAFARHHIEVIAPDDETQTRGVMAAIDLVKAGESGANATALVNRAALRLIDRGAQAVITGCTELPLVYRTGDAPVPVIDPTATLAAAIVRRAKGIR